jgi:hypothetical protein
MKKSPTLHRANGKREAKANSAVATAMTSPVQSAQGFDIALSSGLRSRILDELIRSKVPRDSYVQVLSSLTGRAPNTTRRWIDPDSAGLPDLESLARLCQAFDSDANWMLGLVERRYALPLRTDGTNRVQDEAMSRVPGWVEKILANVDELCRGYQITFMPGDDMEPRIQEGSPIWVNTSINDIQTNGIYLLSYQGRTLVRQVEIRIGEGLLLSCLNPHYLPTLMKDADEDAERGLKVLGRVMSSISVNRL